MGKRNKKHWAANTDDPSGGRKFRLACGMWAWINSAKESGPLWSLCGAAVYRDLAACDPDWYCSDCAKAARLALAAESAPKPSDVVWPKPRPISEAPTDGSCVLGHWSVSGYPRLRGCRWAVVKPGPGLAWFNEQNEPLSEPDYFLPLPPEVK